MKSALLAVVTVVVAGLAVLGYVLYPSPYAAKVNGAVISNKSLFLALASVKANRVFICEQASQSGAPLKIQGASSGTYSSSFIVDELRNLILFELLDQYAAEHHVVSTAAELRSASSTIEASLASSSSSSSAGAGAGGTSAQSSGAAGASACPAASGKAVFDAFPGWYRHAEERAQAELTYVVQGLAAKAGNPSAEHSYYRAHLSEFDTICIDGLVFPSQPAAKAFRARISPGATLASVAAADHQHLDTACVPGNQLPPFVTALAMGAISQPQSNGPGGWVIIQPTSRKLKPFAQVAAQIKQQLTSASSIVQTLLSRLAHSAQVTINPLYGTWSGRFPQLITLPTPPKANVLPATRTRQQTGSAPSATAPATAPGGSPGPGAG